MDQSSVFGSSKALALPSSARIHRSHKRRVTMVKSFFVSKEKPAAVALLAAGLKSADSKKSQKWGASACRVLFVPGEPSYTGAFYDGTLLKYVKALDAEGLVAFENLDAATRKRLRDFLKSQVRNVPAAVLVSLEAPCRYDMCAELPSLSVRGQKSAAEGGNWVYKVTQARVLPRLPPGMKLPNIGKLRVLEPLAAELQELAGAPVPPPSDAEAQRLRQITRLAMPGLPDLA